MKKTMLMLGTFAVLGLLACNQEPEKPVIINQPASEPVVVEAPAPEPVEPKKEDGTTIKIGEDGVSYESKNNDVKISKDSTSVEINAPK